MAPLFFSLIQLLFNGYVELALTIIKLPIFYKQRDLWFYPAWVYALPSWLLKIPISLVESGIWEAIDPYVGRFFRLWLVLFGIHQVASALFRFNVALRRDMIVANTFGTGALVILMVLGGFIMSHNDVKKWWIWGYWISPCMHRMLFL
ncbi:hypothetical protein Droror1_Dr00012292 [Drosera rotundifolia]